MNEYNILCGDCMLLMSKMKDGSVDLIITSPPYNNWRNRRTQNAKADYWDRTNIVYDTYNDKMTDEEYEDWQVRFLNECHRILKPKGTMIYNHKDRIFNFEVKSPLEWILKSDMVYRQRITWDRCGMQAFNPVRFYRVEEDLYVLGKGAKGFFWNKEAAKYLSVWRIPPSRNEQHPCSFPKELVRRCIEAFSEEGMVVLDPMMGSGSVVLTAKEMGRFGIGMDISPNYCEMVESQVKQKWSEQK